MSGPQMGAAEAPGGTLDVASVTVRAHTRCQNATKSWLIDLGDPMESLSGKFPDVTTRPVAPKPRREHAPEDTAQSTGKCRG